MCLVPYSLLRFSVVWNLTYFHLFLHVNFLSVCIHELIFQERQFLAWYYLYTKAVFPLPFTFQGEKPSAKECIYVGVNVDVETLHAQLLVQQLYFSFQYAFKEEAALNLSRSMAGGTGFLYLHIRHPVQVRLTLRI